MALPPRKYPWVPGSGHRCGQDWFATIKITGHLKGTDFGDQFTHTLEPIYVGTTSRLESRRGDQNEARAAIEGTVRQIRRQLGEAKQFTSKQRRSIDWLLRKAEAQVAKAEEIWSAWENRSGGTWPLTADTFYGGVCRPEDGGRWISWEIGRGTMQVLCPSLGEQVQHARDRERVGRLYSDALAHTYCAAYSYWRLRLYYQAYNAYLEMVDVDQPGPEGPKPTPGIHFPGGFVSPTDPVDPCRDFGIDCPPGEEPECPSGLCVDPDTLPDPDDVDIDVDTGPIAPDGGPGDGLGDPLIPEVPGRTDSFRRSGVGLIAAGAGVFVLAAVAYVAMR